MTCVAFILMQAGGDWVRNGLEALNLLISVCLGLGLYWLGGKAREFDSVKTELHATTTKLIDERFRSATHELRGSVQGLVSTIDLMQTQLKDGTVDLRTLGDRDQRIELSLAARVDQLKDFIREHSATKQDLEAHEASMERKVDKLETQISELSRAVAVLSDRSGGKKAAL